MIHRLSLLLIACLAISSHAFAQKVNAPQLDTLFNRLARHNKMMGSVQISRAGKILYQRGFGQAQVGRLTGVDNTPNTIYRIGSVTKMFTATIIFKLVEEKRIRLQDTLGKWFPQMPNAGSITIDQMLNHHSGLHNITDDTSFSTWQDTVHTKAQIIARIAALQPDFMPGEKGEYSNTNFILLGYIIEQVTGMPYVQNLSRRITIPLKLNNTSFGGRSIHPEKGEALPYSFVNGAWSAETPSSTDVAGAAGGIVSTVGDLTQFIDALMRHHFLSDASLAKMKEVKDDYGRGMLRFPFYDRIAYGFNGHIDNFVSNLAFFPKDSTVVSIACNGVNYSFNNMLIGVLSIYYGKPFTMPDFSKKAAVDAAKLKKLEGIYTYPAIGMDITVTATATGLRAQATGQGSFDLEPVSDNEFANDEVGIHLSFEQSGDMPAGKMFVEQGGSTIPFERKK